MGNAGSNYDVIFGQGTSLTYNDSRGNSVNLTITGGGTMGIFRGADGDAGGREPLWDRPGQDQAQRHVKKLSSRPPASP